MGNIIIHPGSGIFQWNTGVAGGSFVDPAGVSFSFTGSRISSDQDFGVTGNLYVDGSVYIGGSAISTANWNTAYDNMITSASFSTSNGIVTLGQQDGGTVTVDLDGRYQYLSSTHDTVTSNNHAVGWYTVAVNEGNRAMARFGIEERSSSRHATTVFYAAANYSRGSTITVLSNSHYSTFSYTDIRIKVGSTYDGALLQVYISDSTNAIRFGFLGDNIQTTGWETVDWVADGVDPGTVTNFAGLVNVDAHADLYEISSGGISTDGPIFAGVTEDSSSDTTGRWEVWHEQNFGADIITATGYLDDRITEVDELYRYVNTSSNNHFVISRPIGGSRGSAGSIEYGYIRIDFPEGTAFGNTMIGMDIDINEYHSANGPARYTIFGYQYTGNSTPPTGFWANEQVVTTSNFTGGYKNVYFGGKDGRASIWIGNWSGHDWRYPQVNISNLRVRALGYSAIIWDKWRTGEFDISITTGEPEAIYALQTVNISQSYQHIDWDNVIDPPDFASSSHSHNIGDLNNVSVGGASSDDILQYDGADWNSTSLSNVSHSDLGDLTAGNPHTQYVLDSDFFNKINTESGITGLRIYGTDVDIEPRLSVGRSVNQSLNIDVQDQVLYFYYSQDESSGGHPWYDEIRSDSGGPNYFYWSNTTLNGGNRNIHMRLLTGALWTSTSIDTDGTITAGGAITSSESVFKNSTEELIAFKDVKETVIQGANISDQGGSRNMLSPHVLEVSGLYATSIAGDDHGDIRSIQYTSAYNESSYSGWKDAHITDGIAGTKAVEFYSTVGHYRKPAFTRPVPLLSGKSYRISLYARQQSGAGNATSYIGANFFASDKTSIQGTSAQADLDVTWPNAGTYFYIHSNIVIPSVWTKYTWTIGPSGQYSIPSSGQYLSVLLWPTYNSGTTDSAHQFQDVRIEELVGINDLEPAVTGLISSASGYLQSQINTQQMDDHNDVNITSVTTADVLYYESSEWINKPISELSHNDFSNLTAGDPHTQYALKTLLTSSSGHLQTQIVSATGLTASASGYLQTQINTLESSDLADVNLDFPDDGHVMWYESNEWTNKPFTEFSHADLIDRNSNSAHTQYVLHTDYNLDYVDNSGLYVTTDSQRDIFVHTVTGGAMGPSGHVKFEIYGYLHTELELETDLYFYSYFGGDTVFIDSAALASSVNEYPFHIKGIVYNRGSVSSQGMSIEIKVGKEGNIAPRGIGELNATPGKIDQVVMATGLTRNTASDQDIRISLSWGAGGSPQWYNIEYAWAEAYKPS